MSQVLSERAAQAKEITRRLVQEQGTSSHNLFLDLLNLKLSQVRDQLVNCNKDDFARVQGEAQAYAKLIRDLTRSPPPYPD